MTCRKPFTGYAFAVAAIILAIGLRFLLDPLFGSQFPYSTVILATAISAWYGGRTPGFFALASGGLSATYFFVEPRLSFAIYKASSQVGLLLYVLIGSAVILSLDSLHRSTAKAEERRQLLETTLSSIGEAVITTNNAGDITQMNDVACDMLSRRREELLGVPLNDVFVTYDYRTREVMNNSLEQAIRERVSIRSDLPVILKGNNGEERLIETTASPIILDSEIIVGGVLIVRDVSVQRRAEEELSDFFQNASVALHWVGPDGTILRANKAELEMLGYSEDEYVGKNIVDFHADPGAIDDILKCLTSGDTVTQRPAKLRAKNGSVKEVLIDSSVLFRDGKFIHTRCFTRDITDLKRSERTSAGQKRVLELLVEGVPLATVLEAVCEIFESYENQQLLTGISLADSTRDKFEVIAGKNLPVELVNFINGIPLTSKNTPQGNALQTGQQAMYPDISHDSMGFGFDEVAAKYPVRAIWSTPILNSKKMVLGTFDVFSGSLREPTQEESNLIELLTRMAGVAIERRADEESLRDASRRKDEFLATLAHELRNPLAPISNALGILRMEIPDQVADQAKDMMERQLKQMVRLIDDLLDISRINSDKLDLKLEVLEMKTIVQEALAAIEPIYVQAKHEIEIDLPKEDLYIRGDSVRMIQIMVNLLSNASKYMKPGGKIWLSVAKSDDMVAIKVKDSGFGIAKEQISKVFDMFMQVGASRPHADGGLGIGLSIVKRLTEMHGGKVSAFSDGPGLGSEFVVTIPLQSPPFVRINGTPENSERVISPLRLLVVDDNKDSADTLAMLLRYTHSEAITAYDGAQAISCAEAQKPDVILLDIGLPDLNGHEVCKTIRQTPWGQHTLIIALTGWGQDEDRQKTTRAGFDGHLVKPLDISTLEILLSQFTESRHVSKV